MAGSADSVRVRVPAKVNLHLSVGPVRPDGFHDLSTVFHAVDLVDELVVTAADELSLTVCGVDGGPVAGVPDDAGNLAWQAAETLARTAGIRAGARLELRKAIPVAGGMAGGSADAAAALVACSRLWGVDADLRALAARLGSDVAFPLLGGTALGTGRGERLDAVSTAGRLHWVFVPAEFGISAGAAYRRLDELRAAGMAPGPSGHPDALLTALAAGDAHAIALLLANDLQLAALDLAPSLGDTLDAGMDCGALAGVVSGSGPTCAFLAADAADAQRLAGELAATGRVARTASGPAAGAG